jgi:hypothetical protein
MSNISIFEQPGEVSTRVRREPSALTKSLMSSNTIRRIQTNTNGTFKRVINGEQVGNAVRGELSVIIVDLLPKVSRVFYAEEYDPNAKATLPNCWSNLGDKPEAGAADKQAANCGVCPQNVDGSGSKGKGRACRFQRRIAVLLEGDPSGDVYQFNIPAKSLFGKGSGNTHPFESYTRFLPPNGFDIDGVVTQIAYDLNSDAMEFNFRPVREITDEEFALVQEAQASPETRQYTALTVAQADKVEKLAAPVARKMAEVVEEVVEEPPPAKVEAPKANSFFAAEPEEAVDEPVKRQTKKADTPADIKRNLADVVSAWSDDE